MAGVSRGCCKLEQDANVECVICRFGFHTECLPSTDRASLEAEPNNIWSCPGCRLKKTRGKNADDRPVGELASPLSSQTHSNITSRGAKRQALSTSFEISPEKVLTTSSEEVRNIVTEAMTEQMKDLMVQLNRSIQVSLHNELKSIRNDMLEVKESLNYFSKEYEDLKREHDLSVKKIKLLEEEKDSMKVTITNLQGRLDNMEQRARQCNVEIQCVPESKHENLPRIVSQICKVVDCKLKEENVTNVTRIAKIDRKNPRPRSIIVEFDNFRNRDTFLAASINYNKKNPTNKLNSTNIGISGERKAIFIVEHLSPTNKALHAAARIKAKEMKYDFVWVRKGRIFVRKNEGADPILIKNMDGLKNIK